MKYDTIIIGAGLSGLAAGIRLAHFEKRVLILERHTTIGGLNSFYRLRARNHDVGLHAVTNYAKPGTKKGPLSKLLRQLRLSWDDFGLCPQVESAVAFPDCTLRFTNEFAFLESQVAERFPSQIDGFRRLVEKIDQHDALSLNREPVWSRPILAEFISDPLLIEMLLCPLLLYGSATPRDMDFNQFVILFQSIYQEGFARPYGGVRQMLKPLVRKYKSLGGELRLRCGVKTIHTHGDRAVSVELDDGEIIEADNVLSSAGSTETLRLVENAQSEAQEYKPGELSFVETIFSLDREPLDFGHKETVIFYNSLPKFHYECPSEPVDIRSGIVCSPNNFQYDEPLDEGRIRITALADPDPWMSWPEEKYVAEKEHWCAAIAEASQQFIPDFRPHIVDTDMFTPRTITKYTGHLNGAVYGAAEKVVDGRTHLENLYLCGTDQGFLGIIGAMLSGVSISNAYLLR
ncbi:phytoene desaturase family protein [Thalassoroseus pseudoceratinae]|uniref:phytoene desaturase family protein n=1 Tax=Thalassoroseus pseudoceratinae TaxID=2713176 RepID=UPI00141F0A5A|nr:NAD(P)/FAD-dependent oxidoreductase [Thalassoroseus pseudoceratinae]